MYATAVGAIIGFERSTSDRPAGVRTMSLVSLGASAFTLCSLHGFTGNFDSSRMASNVASGVGFIGAGVITNNSASGYANKAGGGLYSVRGLTTAAAIWVSAAVGVTAGTGMYFLSMFSAVCTVGVLRLGRMRWEGEIRVTEAPTTTTSTEKLEASSQRTIELPKAVPTSVERIVEEMERIEREGELERE